MSRHRRHKVRAKRQKQQTAPATLTFNASDPRDIYVMSLVREVLAGEGEMTLSATNYQGTGQHRGCIFKRRPDGCEYEFFSLPAPVTESPAPAQPVPENLIEERSENTSSDNS